MNASSTSLRTLKVLELFAHSSKPVSASLIACELGFERTSIYRSLKSLEQAGFIVRSPLTGHYFRSVKLYTLGRGFSYINDKDRYALDAMALLAEETGRDMLCCLVEESSAVVVHRTRLPNVKFGPFNIGDSAPAHCTAVGRAILANSDRRFASHIIQSGLDQLTDRTITDPFKFLAELERVKEEGYSLDERQCHEALQCVAVPIFDDFGGVKFSFSISGSPGEFSKSDVKNYAKILRIGADKLTCKISALKEGA